MFRVLVLEDDPDMRELLAMALTDEGYQVESASGGAQALELARAEPFDLVVADIRMEGMDGLEVIQRVKADRPETRSLVVTGYSTEADSIRAIRLGVGDYLKKPFDLGEFLKSVGRLAAERQRELRQVEPEQAMRRTALFALRALAQTLDQAQIPERPPAGLVAIGRLAAALATEVGLSLSACEETELAVLVALLRRLPAGAALAGIPLAPSVEQVLTHLEEGWAAQPVEARVACVALAAAPILEEEAPTGLALELSRLHPGRFEPAILEALERRSGQPEPPSNRDDDRRRRGLLSLARALEEAGDRAGAEGAYRELVEQGNPSREAVAAWLGLARLARAASQVEPTREHAQQAVITARRLGPGAAGEAALEAGLTLLSVRDPNAWAWLEEAVNLNRGPGETLARLALLYRQGQPPPESELVEPLQVLTRAENSAALAGNVLWLLPLLLEARERQSDGPAVRALGRLARDFPGQLGRALARGNLSVPARLAAVQALVDSSGASAGQLLEGLKADPDPSVAAAAGKALERLGQGDGLPVLRVHSLGALEVFRGDEKVDEGDWKTKKVKYLFAYLMARRERPVGEDTLIELFWPDDAEKGRRNLYSATSALRRSLRPSSFPGELEYVLRVQAMLQINPALPTWHDLDELERALSEATRQRGTSQSMEAARRVAGLYTGPYLDGCYYDWALEVRTRLEQQVSELLLELASFTARLGGERSRAEALELARRVLEVDPCYQEAHLLAMQLFLDSSRPQEAVRQFEQCKRALRQGLGMEPSIEVMEIHQRALLSL
ncbi:MAG: hypothetical protein AMXMBFR33_25270 [Candidatus Xenobia bacterium]